MATNYPGGFDSLSNPSGTDPLDASGVPHASQHANANDAIEAIEATLGLNPQSSWPTVNDRIAAVQAGSITPGVITWTSPGVISVNSASDALRITQTGSGNALVVEDSTNPDATPFTVDAGGSVIVGNTSIFQQGSTIPLLQVQGTSNSSAAFGVARFSNDSDRVRVVLAKSRGALGAQGIVSSGDVIANINAFGSDGTNWVQAAGVSFEVDGTPGTNDMPGRLVFSTTADGASTPTERMRISNAGQVTVGLGTAGAPVLSFSGDTNTGIYSPGADQVSIATAGTAAVMVNSSGNTGFGTTSPTARVDAASTGAANLYATRYSNNSNQSPLYLRKSRGTTVGDNTIVQDGDGIGAIFFQGADGSSFVTAAAIEANVNGTFTAGSATPSRLSFQTTPTGSTTLTERMRIDNAGLITGTGTSLGAWTAYTPTLAGTGWAIGNGTVTGVYSQIGKWVAFSITVTFGSTSTFGAGSATLTVPGTMKSSDRITVNAWGVDTSLSQTYALMVTPSSTSAFFMGTIGTNGLRGGVISSNPFTWADTDVIRVTGFYEAA